MVSNHLQIGLGLGLGYSSNNYSTDFNGNEILAQNTSLSFRPDLTYYLDNRLYAYVGGNYSPIFAKDTYGSNVEPFSRTINNYEVKLGIGYLLPINEHVFLNGFAGIKYKNLRQTEQSILGVSLEFQNFVPSIFGKKPDDTPQYLQEGRSIVAGNFDLNYIYEGGGSVSMGASFSRLKFRNSHFAFGYYGGASLFTIAKRDDNYSLSGGTKARYYVPMSKRWFIYPELGLGLAYNKSNGNTDVNFVLSKSVGVNYFLTPNVALDVNVNFGVNSNSYTVTQQTLTNNNANSNISFGVTYFIDKLF